MTEELFPGLPGAVKLIQQTAVEADAYQIEMPDKTGMKHQIGIGWKDSLEFKDIPPPDRHLYLDNLQSLVDLAVHGQIDGMTPGDQAIFVDGGGVGLIFNTGNGYESAYLNLETSLELEFVQGWIPSDPQNVIVHQLDPLVNILRYVLRDATPQNLIAELQGVNFRIQSQVQNENTRPRQSIGTSEVKEIVPGGQGESATLKLPADEQVFNVMIWKNGDMPYRELVRVIVDPELNRAAWMVVTLEESLAFARTMALIHLADDIRKMLGYESPKPDTEISSPLTPVYIGRWNTDGPFRSGD